MPTYRARRACILYVEELGREVDLTPDKILHDDDEFDAAIIRQYGQSALRADNIEQATAAPGELRTTRRQEA